MRTNLFQPRIRRRMTLCGLGLGMILSGITVQAQESAPVVDKTGWERYDWLGPDPAQKQAAPAETATVRTTQDVNDPFSALSSGALWQQKYDAVYTRRLNDMLTLTYETSSVMVNETSTPTPSMADGSPDNLSRGQSIGMQFQPASGTTFGTNLHETTTDASLPGDAQITRGAGFSAQTPLPFDSNLSLGMNTDISGTDATSTDWTTKSTYDAQLRKPLGTLPLTAVIKGHFEQISVPGTSTGSLPTLEQSVVWKPAQDATVQMGLRQQQYQEYPGVSNQFNEALFADWSQNIMGAVTWHSYAEVLNSRGMIDQAPAAPIASGANGTPQATIPGSNTSPTSSLPLSFEDQTVTFTTGPSFQLQKDLSASFEYSNRWDKNPAAGSVGQEQRVSVSVKGSF